MLRVALRPGPSLDVKEAGGADDDIVRRADGREGDRRSGIAPGESSVDVAGGLGLVLRDGAPLVKVAVPGGRGRKPVDMAVVKRFETNVLPGQHKIFGCHS